MCRHKWQLEGYPRDCVYQQQLDAKYPLLLRVGEGRNNEQGAYSNTGNSQTLVYLIILIARPINRKDGAHRNTCICRTEGRCPWPRACMYLLWNQANHECINTTAQPDLGVGRGNHRPQGTMLQRQSEALNTGAKRYSPSHCTHNSYIKSKETMVYTCKRLWSEKMNKEVDPCTGRACLSTLHLLHPHKVTWDHRINELVSVRY